jgi:hypothetical protein
MLARTSIRLTVIMLIGSSLISEAQCWAGVPAQESAVPVAAPQQDPAKPGVDGRQSQAAPTMQEVADRAIKREGEQNNTIQSYSPLIETYIQEIRLDKELGVVPQIDRYFLSQADFRKGVRVRSLIDTGKKGSLFFSFAPAGFLQMIFIDRGEFDRAHYQFKYVRREFLGEVRCYVFDVIPQPKVRGARFVGRIWIEDQDFFIVHFNGIYTPAIHFSFKTLEDEYYLHFDSWRTNVKNGLWLPSYIFSEKIQPPFRFDVPNYKSQTRLWGYKLTAGSQTQELNRLLVEDLNTVKDEAPQQDRSPLEAQRAWRHQAESNVLELLENHGLLAPPGPVDVVLNTVVNNLIVTNNLDGQVDLTCRVLNLSTLEVFSIGNTIVVSRGLIDTVPDEAALATILAHGMADALNPKPFQDQYAFSDIMRLTVTEVLKRLTFEENPTEAAVNSQKAVEFLQKSPYSAKLSNAGLYLKQLQLQAKALKHLISPQLGNGVFLESKLIHGAPALETQNKQQIAALPLGSRIKIDAWGGEVSLLKAKATALMSAREKMPFEVTPSPPQLKRYVESSESESDSAMSALDD